MGSTIQGDHSQITKRFKVKVRKLVKDREQRLKRMKPLINSMDEIGNLHAGRQTVIWNLVKILKPLW